jgi:hypothetical protein
MHIVGSGSIINEFAAVLGSEVTPTSRNRYADDLAIDIVAVGRAIYSVRQYAFTLGLVSFVSAIIYLHVAHKKYYAKLQIFPAQSSDAGLSSKLGGLGGLASLAGVSLSDNSGGNSFRLFTDGLHSLSAAQKLGEDEDLLAKIFPANWDSKSKTWRESRGIGVVVTATLKSTLNISPDKSAKPSPEKLRQYIADHVEIVRNSKDANVTLKFEHEDRNFSRVFLNRLHVTVDDMVRERSLAQSQRYIDYISRKLESITLAEHRSALIESLSEQEKMNMMARANSAFAAETLEAATASEKPSSPNAPFVLGGLTLLGLISGTLFGLLRRNNAKV